MIQRYSIYKIKNIHVNTHTHTLRTLASDEVIADLEADDAQYHERRQEGIE